MARKWFCTVKRFLPMFFKTVIFLIVISFLWLQLRIINVKPALIVHLSNYSDVEWALFPKYNDIILSINTSTPASIFTLSNIIEEINSLQTVNNLEKFGGLGENDLVIVIQVHNRAEYLYALIESLRHARYINQTLLVFSHDLYDVRINALIQRIDFAKVLQMFYPYSIQLHPNGFPGPDPNDCPRAMKIKDAIRIGCNNAMHPDLYGHYREAKFTQTKHHWWWKMNRLINGLSITSKHGGPVLLLEDDHYVSPDFLHVLRMMERLRTIKCPTCKVLCLGTYVKSYNYPAFSKKIEITKWLATKHNMGMVINRTLWEEIKNCSKAFCSFDDYNWDWSIQHVSATCLSSPLTVMVAMAPRVIHVGECGIHHKRKDCGRYRDLQKIMRTLNSSNQSLFPSTMAVQQSFKRPFKAPKGNGGWGDIRDHALCCSQVKNISTECN